MRTQVRRIQTLRLFTSEDGEDSVHRENDLWILEPEGFLNSCCQPGLDVLDLKTKVS